MSGSKRFGYVPALDGVRALAVGAVVLFHAGFGFASGGFVGVSVFFTLSGFLITSLLIAEHNHSGSISLGAFYGRRARRLLPAAFLCIALVLAAVPFWSPAQRDRLPGDALASMANVANWRAANATLSYRELFSSEPGPLAHFWSLAIEEQCYLLLPVVIAWALRRGRSRLAVIAAALLVASVAAALLTTDFDLAYNGTHTRIAEVLVGVLLAVMLTYRTPRGRVPQVAGLLGLAALAGATWRLQIGDEWLAHGGFVAVSVATCAVTLAAIGGGPVARLLAQRPLVAVGKVSYGVYLFHWPLFLILDEQRTGLGRWPLLAVRLACLTAISYTSFRLLERPVRERRLVQSRRPAAVALLGSVITLLLAVWALPSPRLNATELLLERGDDGPVTFASPPSPAQRATVLVLGSNATGAQLLSASDVNADVVDRVQRGCPVASGIEVRLLDGERLGVERCVAAGEYWASTVEEVQPDLVVVSMGDLDDGLVRPATTEGFPAAGDWTEIALLEERARAEVIDVLLSIGRDDVPVLIYWPENPAVADLVARRVAVAPAASLGMAVDGPDLIERVRGRLSSPSTAAVPHVLVIGDSTSLTFAAALDLAAGGSVQVLWAGHNGCPFVRAEAVRARAEEDWATPDCDDFADTLPPILASFRPDVVYLVAGAMELTMQRYPGDPSGHLPGSTTYRAFHDAEMSALLDVLGDGGPPVFVADSPAIGEGPFSQPELTEPERLAAWNAQVARWGRSSARVHVVGYAALIEGYEAQNGSIRPDGSHPEVEPLAQILAQTLLPELLAFVAAAR